MEKPLDLVCTRQVKLNREEYILNYLNKIKNNKFY